MFGGSVKLLGASRLIDVGVPLAMFGGSVKLLGASRRVMGTSSICGYEQDKDYDPRNAIKNAPPISKENYTVKANRVIDHCSSYRLPQAVHHFSFSRFASQPQRKASFSPVIAVRNLQNHAWLLGQHGHAAGAPTPG